MNLRDMTYIIAVAESHHFGKAAERCFVSQPTLSGQIKKLEQQLGVMIFERSKHSVKVTPVGKMILEHARVIVEQTDAIRQLALAHRDPLAGPLRVGAIPTLSPYLIPFFLSSFKRIYQQIELIWSEATTDILLNRLAEHELDAVLIATTVEQTDFHTLPLFQEPFWLAHAYDHPLYNKENIQRSDLQKIELLMLSEEHCLAQQATAFCSSGKSQSGSMDFKASSLETLMHLVKAGFGSTLVPALAASGSWASGSGIVMRPLAIKGAGRCVRMVYRNTFPRVEALQVLKNQILENLPNTVQPLEKTNKGKKTKTKRRRRSPSS